MIDRNRTQLVIPAESGGQRFDAVLAGLLPEHSRARLQQWIRDGMILLDGRIVKSREKLLGGERVDLTLELTPDERWEAQDIPLQVVYRDADLLVIDKPAGLVVHPAAGNPDGTLVNALLHHFPELACLPRAGIVHRLDKDTSGLMVVAMSARAHTALVAQLQDRSMGRQYEALVIGNVTAEGHVDLPIGRHPRNRLKMAVVATGKPAWTEYFPLRRWPAVTHLRLRLRTGRTHQIRVHLSHIRLPIIGDPLYTSGSRLPTGLNPGAAALITGFGRQALHAKRLELVHPASGRTVVWEIDLPADMRDLITGLTALAGDGP